MIEKKILLTDCPDDKGLIAKITNICYKHQLNILHNNEFVDFEIGLLVNSLREFNIISDDLYNLFMFGTNDIKELQISQLGLSKNLYNTLKKDNQIQNIEFDDFHNPRANHHLREYILSKQGIEKFELEQYFL